MTESVRDVLAEMRAAIERYGSLTALSVEVVDRIEAALEREQSRRFTDEEREALEFALKRVGRYKTPNEKLHEHASAMYATLRAMLASEAKP